MDELSEFSNLVDGNTENLNEIVKILPRHPNDLNKGIMLGQSLSGEMVARVELLEDLTEVVSKSFVSGGSGGSGSGASRGLLSSISSWLNSIKSKIKNKISSTFWNIVNNLQNPENWTITGNAGFQMMGLSGTVDLSVTYE